MSYYGLATTATDYDEVRAAAQEFVGVLETLEKRAEDPNAEQLPEGSIRQLGRYVEEIMTRLESMQESSS